MSKDTPNESKYSLAFWRGQIRCAGYEVISIGKVTDESISWKYDENHGMAMKTERLLKEAVSE